MWWLRDAGPTATVLDLLRAVVAALVTPCEPAAVYQQGRGFCVCITTPPKGCLCVYIGGVRWSGVGWASGRSGFMGM